MKNNIELYIDGHLMDVYGDDNVVLSKSFEDLENTFEIVESEYSYEFSLPRTENNRKVFGFTDAFDTPYKFDKLYDAKLYAGGTKILDGMLLINEIDNESFKVNVYVPAQQSVEELFDGMTLRQISEHNISINTLSELSQINLDALENEDNAHICFPFLLYGHTYNNITDENVGTIPSDVQMLDDNFLNMNNIYPSFRILSVIKDIFKSKGYEVEGSIFNDGRFKGLWQTYSDSDEDRYNEVKQCPYYLGFTGSYELRDEVKHNTSSTARMETESYWERCVDSALLSENIKLSNINNEYGILTQGKNGGYVIAVPKSGWYQIKCDGSAKLTWGGKTDRYKQEDRVYVMRGSADPTQLGGTDLVYSPLEFVIKKGTPLQKNLFYSKNSFVPCMPNEDEDSIRIERTQKDGKYTFNIWLKCRDDSRQNYYGGNGSTTLIKSIGGIENDVIVGARFGGALSENMMPSDYISYCSTLPNASKTMVQKEFDGVKYVQLMSATRGGANVLPVPSTDYTHGGYTAQIFAPENDCFFNFNGYNKYNPDTNTWDTTTKYKKQNWYGQTYNTASVEDLSQETPYPFKGVFNMSNCIWLEEGEQISIELNIPTGYSRQGRVAHDVLATYNFKMGLVNTDKDWVPTAENPIPTVLDSKMLTNVNLLLPDTGCNDYISNFLQTFNLKMTKKSDNLYSIDSNFVEMNGKTNTVDLDGMFNLYDASFKRLDLPTRKSLKWTIDVDEYGYKNGSIGNFDPYTVVPEEYDGSKVFENKTNTMENDITYTSQWSYNWYKDITFKDNNGNTTRYPVPIICEAKEFEKENGDIGPNHTPRLFYLDKDKSLRFSLDSQKYILLLTKNHYGPFILDYGTPTESLHAENISDTFFKVNLATQYRVDIPVILPNHVYESIKANSLAKANGGLYRFLAIDGHDVSEMNPSTVSLITLK